MYSFTSFEKFSNPFGGEPMTPGTAWKYRKLMELQGVTKPNYKRAILKKTFFCPIVHFPVAFFLSDVHGVADYL